ncbi:hypothetical protein PQI51_01275 [Microbacterium esteraromaticum]|jgi:hypothetical protein|uniref:hypothetical protein n=1 Tax=Microbacterium esteraromaticum TaxID=57043 RepID=UPI003096643D
MLIRPASVDDAHDLAVVHVRSWQQAYRGLMPQAVLDGLSIAEREAGWARLLGIRRRAQGRHPPRSRAARAAPREAPRLNQSRAVITCLMRV